MNKVIEPNIESKETSGSKNKTIRILDIDLDFFLEDCCDLALPGERPDVRDHEPWEEKRVCSFLEDNCGLNSNKPIPGRIFETHDSALCFWAELIDSGFITPPFHVTHVDAHSDLGIGKPGPGFVLNNVISMKPYMRPDIKRYYEMHQLDEANYLLFAIAFRFISSLDNIRNPKSRPDIPAFAYKNELGSDYTHIQLSSFASKLFEASNGKEPCIPFKVYDDYKAFKSEAEYDFISLAISPRYSPKEADALIEPISRYIRNI